MNVGVEDNYQRLPAICIFSTLIFPIPILAFPISSFPEWDFGVSS